MCGFVWHSRNVILVIINVAQHCCWVLLLAVSVLVSLSFVCTVYVCVCAHACVHALIWPHSVSVWLALYTCNKLIFVCAYSGGRRKCTMRKVINIFCYCWCLRCLSKVFLFCFWQITKWVISLKLFRILNWDQQWWKHVHGGCELGHVLYIYIWCPNQLEGAVKFEPFPKPHRSVENVFLNY